MKRQWTPDELIDQWTLTIQELEWIGNKTAENRLGFALLLKYFQQEGHFPQRRNDVPGVVITFIAQQIGVSAEVFLHYAWDERTMEYHRAAIRELLHYHKATVADTTSLQAWLCTHQLTQEHRVERLEEAVAAECRRRFIEPPTSVRVTRMIQAALHAFETDLYRTTLARLTATSCQELDALIYDLGDLPDFPESGDDPDALDLVVRTTRSSDEVDQTLLPSVASSVPAENVVLTGTGSANVLDQDGSNELHDLLPVALRASLPLPTLSNGPADTADTSTRNWEDLLDWLDIADTLDAVQTQQVERVEQTKQTAGKTAQIAEETKEEEKKPLTLHDLRVDPGSTGVESVLREVAKLRRLRQIALPNDLFVQLAPRVLEIYRTRAAVETPSALRAHPEATRYTLLAALCWARQQEVTDNLVTLLLALVKRISTRAERRVEQAYMEEIRHVHGKTGLLYRVAEAALATPDGTVRDVVFPVISETTLRDLVKEYKASGTAYRQQMQLVMRTSFKSHYRRMLPPLLEVLEFHSNNPSHQPVIEALKLVRQYLGSGLHLYPADEKVSLIGVVEADWHDLVLEEDADGTPRYNRLNYELSALRALR